MEIRALEEADDRATFCSGDLDLDRFLQKYAGQNQFRHHIGITYVAVEGRQIMGYATVAAGHIEIDDLPVGRRKKFPRYPLPVLRLARLAVGATWQGQKVGLALLRYVLKLALRMREEFGCVGVAVDAKPAAIDFYRRFGFFPLQVHEGQSASRPPPTPMFLPAGDIDQASRTAR